MTLRPIRRRIAPTRCGPATPQWQDDQGDGSGPQGQLIRQEFRPQVRSPPVRSTEIPFTFVYLKWYRPHCGER